MSTRIEIVGRVSGRRRWTVEQKLAILRDAFGPEGSVGDACKRHAIGSGSIYTWRRQAMSGELGGARPAALPTFAEVELSAPVPALPGPGGHIGIELPSGVKLTVDAGVDAEALARVIAVLTR
ncbi:MAG: transposase [Novosphingobium sp.]